MGIKDDMVTWNQRLLSLSDTIVYRIANQTKPTDNFLNDTAYALETLAQRIRRCMKDKQNDAS